MNSNCKISGCDRTTKVRGLCQSHYNRFHANGTLEDNADPSKFTEPFHRLTEVDLESRTGTCSVCGPATRIRGRAGGRLPQCMTKEREREAGRTRQRKPRGPASWRQRKYGLTPDAYAALADRAGGRCELCGADFNGDERVDHCHETGVVRGLLCNRCNFGLGWFEDDPARLLAAYMYVKAGGKTDTAA